MGRRHTAHTSVTGAYLSHDGQVVVGGEPHGPAGLGPLPLKELPQQPLHLAVAGIRTLHRLLGVQTGSGADSTHTERDTYRSRTAAAEHAMIGQSQPLTDNHSQSQTITAVVEISIVRHNRGQS